MQINKSVYLLLLDKYIYFFVYQRYNLLHLPQLSLLKYTTIFLCVCRNCRNQFLIFILLDVSQLFRFLNTCYDKFLSDRLIYHDHHPHHLHLYHYHHWEISEKKKRNVGNRISCTCYQYHFSNPQLLGMAIPYLHFVVADSAVLDLLE